MWSGPKNREEIGNSLYLLIKAEHEEPNFTLLMFTRGNDKIEY